MRIAILVDGAFYRRRARRIFGNLEGKDRAQELYDYCTGHVRLEKRRRQDRGDKYSDPCTLYRVFYYDCEPSMKRVEHPLTGRTIDLSKTDVVQWMHDFLEELKKKRKLAIRLGKIQDTFAAYSLKPQPMRDILRKKRSIEDLTEFDFNLSITQKGVDMKIGLDIASLAYKKQVDQIVLISGDSDFVSAAKLARREGIDFILDPMGAQIKPDLFEHIDGLRSADERYTESLGLSSGMIKDDEW